MSCAKPDAAQDQLVQTIARFLAEKGVKTECPFCGHPTWSLLDKPDFRTALLSNAARSYGLYTLTCNNCGFVRSHLAHTIETYVATVKETNLRSDITGR